MAGEHYVPERRYNRNYVDHLENLKRNKQETQELPLIATGKPILLTTPYIHRSNYENCLDNKSNKRFYNYFKEGLYTKISTLTVNYNNHLVSDLLIQLC